MLLTMRLGIFLIVPSLLSIPIAQALPSRALYQPLSVFANSTANDIIPFCFSQQSHPGIEPTNAPDCYRALRRIILERGFAIPLRFSRNPRRTDAVKLPKGWIAGNCVIFVSCANSLDADFFRYADVARAARNTIELCVDVDDPLQPDQRPYGGLENVGTVGTFYVSVGPPVVAALSKVGNSTVS